MAVQTDTPFPVLSAGKPMAAMTIAWLQGRGRLDVNAPIAEIFPEFARHGKGDITTRDVLTHRSGLLMPDFVAQPQSWSDRQAIQEALIETIPTYPRGTLAYHPHEFGWILNEVVLRVEGRSLPQVFHQEFADPLGLRALRYGLAGRDPVSVAFSYWLGKDKVMVAGQNVAAHFEDQNSPLYLNAQNPATSMVTDASSLAAFYDFLLAGGQTPEGEQLLSRSLVKTYTSLQVKGWDRSLGIPNTLGYGFMIGGRGPSSFGWWGTQGCFGHGGGFCCLAFGDRRIGLSIAIVTNGNRSLMDSLFRFVPLAHSLRRAF
jgi:CubicO group peptidase (beta-lactamase class C family)